MTQSFHPDYANSEIHELLALRREVAVIWSVEDVQNVRPDLDADQSWEVLQKCERVHDCNLGFTWLLIETVAEDLFPSPETESASSPVCMTCAWYFKLQNEDLAKSTHDICTDRPAFIC